MSGTALCWMILGEWRAHPARILLGALAIAIGVALGFAVHLINASALTEFARAVSAVDGAADLRVESTLPRGFDEALYPRLARLPGIAAASPVVSVAADAGADAPLTLLGLDALRAREVTPSLLGVPLGDPFDGEAAYLSSAALAAAGRRVGDRIDFAADGLSAGFAIAGTLPGVAEGEKVAVIDIAAAQWRFGRLGRLQRVDLELAAGADPERVRAAIVAILPADAAIASRASAARRSDSLSRAYRVNLDMLALVALLTGGFLVYSAQALSVSRRHGEFALLRVLGTTRRAVLAQILLEGIGVGTIGAGCGLLLGLGLAAAALDLLGGDLGGGYFSGASPALVFAPYAALLFMVLGLAAALIGSLLPAWQAARTAPAIALKTTGDAIDPRRRPAIGPALILLILGAASAFAPAIEGLPLLGYLSMALILAGGVAAMPWAARRLLAPLQRIDLGSVPLGLACRRLWGAPSQAAVALCGIVASTSLMIAMAVMVSSFRGSVDDWLEQILSADLYLRAEPGGSFDPAQQHSLAGVPGIAAIRFLESVPLTLAADRPPLALIARAIDPAEPGRALPLIGRPSAVPPGEMGAWLSEPAMWLYGLRQGDRLTLPIAGAPVVFIAGIWRDYSRQFGAIAIGEADYTRLTGDAGRSEAAIDLQPGADPKTVTAAIRQSLPAALAGRLDIAEPRLLRQMGLRLFDRSFAVTYLLEAIAILVGLAGVAATVSAQTLARTREFGMLRHIGVRRRDIGWMLAAEGALLGGVGGIGGIALGIAMSQVLIQVVNPQSFHWTMATRLPLGLFAFVGGALILAASATALLAGRGAMSEDAVRAVREDY